MINIDLPEMFHTINYFDTPTAGGVSFFIFLGLGFLFFAFLLDKWGKYAPNKLLLALFLLFWIPGYFVHLYNNFYDMYENLEIISYDDNTKSKLRFCNMDKYRGYGGYICGILELYSKATQAVPLGSTTYLKGSVITYPYFYYWYYPHFTFVASPEDAQTVLLYYPDNLYYDPIGMTLKLKSGSVSEPDEEKLLEGKYRVIASLHKDALLLKKTLE